MTIENALSDALGKYFAADVAEPLGEFMVDTGGDGPWHVVNPLVNEQMLATDPRSLGNASRTLLGAGVSYQLRLSPKEPAKDRVYALIRFLGDAGHLSVQVFLLRWKPGRGLGSMGTVVGAVGLRFERGWELDDRHAFAHCQLTACLESGGENFLHQLLAPPGQEEPCSCVGCASALFDSIPSIPIAVPHDGSQGAGTPENVLRTIIAAARLTLDGCRCIEHQSLRKSGDDCVRCGAIFVPER